MNTMRVARLGLTALVLGAAAFPASAAFTYDLSITGSFVGTGTITLNDTSGSGVGDSDFQAFSFTVTSQTSNAALLPFTFTKSMVSDVMWSITGGLLSLELEAGAFDSLGIYGYFLSFDTILPSETQVCSINLLSSAGMCTEYVIDQTASVTPGELSATLNVGTTVPEPATLALFGIGLAGLGFAHRKR